MKKKRPFTTTRIIMLGFFFGAIVGAGLLYMPISLKQGVRIDFIDSLFVAVSSICVTGLSTVNIGQTFSILGQIILLILIQLGGLGIVTFTTILLVAFRRKITLADRLLIQSAYNLDTLSGLVALTLKIVKVTLLLELFGACCYAIVFIADYGPVGIWYAIFHSVSAFCNAGIDILGGNSLCAYRDNPVINFTTMFLIIAGGLGFPVYWEIVRMFKKKKDGYKKRMSFHARLVILTTVLLTLLGALITFVLEYDNPDTLATLTIWQKLQASLFQSVTLRTAGFATIDQASFRPASVFSYLLFMFIGGSPAGTAGGVKTVTLIVLLASVVANIKGKPTVTMMKRAISDTTIRRCVSIVFYSFSVLFGLTIVLLAMYPEDILAVLYEIVSAIGTVGLSRGLTGELNLFGKIIVSIAMYLGRIGPITFALAFNASRNKAPIAYPEEKVIIG